MGKVSCFIIFLVGINLWTSQDKLPAQLPKYLDMEMTWQDVSKSEFVFEFTNSDSMVVHEMMLLRNDLGLPQLYFSDIETPVCIDGLCKPVFIEMYWDLMGDYVGFGVHPQELLSKYDHEEFEDLDYLKLHQLLRDPHSVLGKRSIESLYDVNKVRKESIRFKGNKVDGITGATRKEITASVVDGALYSCYTLWYLAHGAARVQIQERLGIIYTDNLQNSFLESSYVPYQFHAVMLLDSNQIAEKIDQLIPIIKTGTPLLRSYILKKSPNSVFKNPLFIDEIYANLNDLDFNSKTLLIEKLLVADKSAFEAVSGSLDHLSKNQIKSFLKNLNSDIYLQTAKVKMNLEEYLDEPNSTYGYLVKAHLEANN